ncbi:chemotaxis protein CheC [Trinickia caryophylli]|uniref:CheC, inhibitor of MCP methylation n=1 Tax=Trinickia caryophylli TaxID=28094 RepID=A0A1X7G4F4_TRICW|nr:chemotaxis protein CheC [Trinickia caryophylli]PMS13775.1 chemotaxis protein [Trinickia caryophylli]TRX14275.1 chemotaxis protein [Trinickia caryophylli]WQE14106.1 chemotaxis protein CheC [Trinickia caryophylli]SMF63787.1 CheC, inhibitor of MCP methylation [Trinickia caryophylli]GLU33400.1 chemotaxis protein [Trinickia caryophylli]
MHEHVLTEEQRDALQEVANLAMGQAATRLAGLLDTFIELSVPRVRVVNVEDAARTLREMTGIDESVTAVRQGFRSDIKGEALVICRSAGVGSLCSLVNDPYVHSAYESVSETELMFDVANVLTGACVSCIMNQLDRTPVFSAPGLLGENVALEDVFQADVLAWRVALLLEVNFALEDQTFRAHLVMLMAEDSIRRMHEALNTILSSL